jgi:hypothetical protein
VSPDAVASTEPKARPAAQSPLPDVPIPAPIPLHSSAEPTPDVKVQPAQPAAPSGAEESQEEILPSEPQIPSPTPEPEPEPESEAPKGPLIPELPEIPDIQGMFRMLVGNDVHLISSPSDRVTAFSRKTKSFYIAKLIDDDDGVVGGMIVDLVALVRLGGGLLMMPEEVLKEQIEAKQPEGDVIESMSEVFNTASSLINEIEGNPHIRVAPVEVLHFSEFPWLENPKLRVDMEDEHGGKIILVSR